MDKPLYVIEPYKHSIDGWLIGLAAIVLACLAGIFYFNKNKTLDYNRRNIIKLVLNFFLIIAAGMMVVHIYSVWILKPIEIYNNRIKTPYGEAPLSNVMDYYIKLEKKYKPMQTGIVQDSANYFFIIERNNKTHVLSEGDYPINDILDKMNEAMGYDPSKKEDDK